MQILERWLRLRDCSSKGRWFNSCNCISSSRVSNTVIQTDMQAKHQRTYIKRKYFFFKKIKRRKYMKSEDDLI